MPVATAVIAITTRGCRGSGTTSTYIVTYSSTSEVLTSSANAANVGLVQQLHRDEERQEGRADRRERAELVRESWVADHEHDDAPAAAAKRPTLIFMSNKRAD